MSEEDKVVEDIIDLVRRLTDKYDMAMERMRHYDAYIDNLIYRLNEVEKIVEGMKQQFLVWIEGRRE